MNVKVRKYSSVFEEITPVQTRTKYESLPMNNEMSYKNLETSGENNHKFAIRSFFANDI